MKAIEIKNKYVKEELHDKVGVIAITSGKKITWWHIHDNEDIPEDMDIAIHIRYPKKKE